MTGLGNNDPRGLGRDVGKHTYRPSNGETNAISTVDTRVVSRDNYDGSENELSYTELAIVMVAVVADKAIQMAKDHPRAVVGALGVISGTTAMAKGGPKVRALTGCYRSWCILLLSRKNMRSAWFS
jgi:hypothetical protein